MGVSVNRLIPRVARTLTYNGDGVLITSVTAGGPADQAGLRPNDIVTHVDGQAVFSTPQIPSIVASHRPGETVMFRIWRLDQVHGGVAMEIPVTLDRLDPAVISVRTARFLEDYGLIDLATANAERAAEFGVSPERGVLVRGVLPRSDAAAALEPGSIIVAVNDQPITSLDELYVRLERQRSFLQLRGLAGVAMLRVVTPRGQVLDLKVPIDQGP